MTRKAFTVEEANAQLPQLEDAFQRIEVKKSAVRYHDQQLQILDALWGPAIARSTNPDHAAFYQHHQSINELGIDIKRIVAAEFLAVGVRFPGGGLSRGLLDFPTTYQGRWVLLCWQRGEPRVAYWHELDAGYAGRQAITAEHVIAMGREDDPAAMDDSALNF